MPGSGACRSIPPADGPYRARDGSSLNRDGHLPRDVPLLCVAQGLGHVAQRVFDLAQLALVKAKRDGTIRGTMFSTKWVAMKIDEDVKPVTFMKTRAADLLRTVSESRRPVVITQSGKPRGVLMDFQSYRELRQATLLLRLLAQGEADVRSRKTVPQERVFSEMRSRLKRR